MRTVNVENVAYRTLQVDSGALARLVKASAFAVGGRGEPPVMRGIHVCMFDDGITLFATDRYRLTRATLGACTTLQAEVTVSGADMLREVKTWGRAAGPVIVTAETAGLRLDVAQGSRTFDAIDGQFPDIVSLLARDTMTEGAPGAVSSAWNAEYMSDGFRACATASPDKNATSVLTFTSSGAAWIRPQVMPEDERFAYLLMPVKLR